LFILGVLAVCAAVVFVIVWDAHVGSSPAYSLYKQIDIGMPYDEVTGILSGLNGPSSGDSVPDGTYRWSTHDGMVWVDLTFRNSRVVNKDITNWEI
jgi:hypothetical protein